MGNQFLLRLEHPTQHLHEHLHDDNLHQQRDHKLGDDGNIHLVLVLHQHLVVLDVLVIRVYLGQGHTDPDGSEEICGLEFEQ